MAEKSTGELAFLETLLKRYNGRISVLVYRIPTHTEQYLHYSFPHQTNCKENAIFILLNRAYSIITNKNDLTLKTLGAGSIWLPHPPHSGFSKTVFYREMVKPLFLVTFNIITNDIFAENVIEIYHVVRKIWRFSSKVLAIFANFLDFSTFTYRKKANGTSIKQMMLAVF